MRAMATRGTWMAIAACGASLLCPPHAWGGDDPAGLLAHGACAAAQQAAAAAKFERLKARLRQLVGTNNTMR